MAVTVAFYTQQAENCRKAASEATLANERVKFLRAQAAWQALADKMARLQGEAAKREAERGRTPPQ
jgi:hypothetical protein